MNLTHPFDPLSQSRARSGGWSASVPMAQGQSGPSPALQVHFRNPMNRDENGEPIPVAEVYTIRFALRPPSTGSNGSALSTTVDCYAWVRSTVAGNPIDSQVSVGYRTAMTVTAEAVNISLYDQTNPSFYSGSGPLPYEVLVQIAPGLRASFETPPTLEAFTDVVDGSAAVDSGVVTIAASGAARYPIPQNAGVVSCEVVVVDAVNAGNVPKVGVVAMTASIAAKTWNPVVNTGFVVLPPNATYVEVNNASSLNGVYATLTWGIEG